MSLPGSPIPELLAPAGDAESLSAALEAGADAVYFGLDQFNARRRAGNFRIGTLAATVRTVHSKGARAYLALNTDLDEGDVPSASRILDAVREARVDAVIVRDLSLLALRPEFPELGFHLSTQAGVACSADVRAARELGVSRVVLAREMSLAEIAAASAIPGIETEVFVQGALCFCVSGRCLLSSWMTGRSANRGLCASPCRLPWHAGEPAANPTPFSMLDLAAIHRLSELGHAGVAALKIEGRLKTAEWVAAATRLYREAMRSDVRGADLLEAACGLSANTGRQSTSAYLDGDRAGLTGLSSRQAVSRRAVPAAEYEFDGGAADYAAYELFIHITADRLQCRVVYGGRATRFDISRGLDAAARPQSRHCVPVSTWLHTLSSEPILEIQIKHAECNDPGVLITSAQAGRIREQIALAIRRTPPAGRDHASERRPQERDVRTAGVSAGLPVGTRGAALALGRSPDRVRLDMAQALAWPGSLPPGGAVVEGATAATLDPLLAACPTDRLVIALPAVWFDENLPSVCSLVSRCVSANVAIEVNNLAGLHLVREMCPHSPLEAGPGLAALNSAAAGMLARAGARNVTLSLEADRRQIEEVAAACDVPLSLTVFGRPPLLITRAEPPEFREGRLYTGERGLRLICRRESGLWIFRPEIPFDLRGQRNDNIRVAHLAVDLIASPDPAGEWSNIVTDAPLFNYARVLA